ncbi:SEN1 N terminal-domain-containing protein [Xylariaceae sp. FL0255]|nr:SEN1 N terminal-domain-containing protein [Xylariaceae sp. FL0255]
MSENPSTLIPAFEKLSEIPDGCHLFCPRISDTDFEAYLDPHAETDLTPAEKEERISAGYERLHIMQMCSLVLGYGQDAAGAFLAQFDSRSDAFLRSCADCVRNWHKARKPFLEDMKELYDETVVDALATRLDEFDFARIRQGLTNAKEFIDNYSGAVSQSVFVKEGREELLIALFEAICCMPYLRLPENRLVFNFVFDTIQERKPLKLEEILPTMTYFLFDENAIRRNFATQAFGKKPPITKDDFDWAIDESLGVAIIKANDIKTDPAYLQRFWQGLTCILNALEGDLMAECLRGMAVQPSIYNLMMNQICHIHSVPVLKAVLTVFCIIVEKSPRAFDQWTPPVILEQIIRSPAFRPFLMQSGEHDMTSTGPAAVSWVSPFLDSVASNQKTDACDKLAHHLLEDIANSPDMTPEGKFACCRGAIEALSSSLKGFLAPNYNLSTASSAIHTAAALNLTMKYKDLIIQLAQLRGSDLQQKSLARATLLVVRDALQLDSRITVTEWNTLSGKDKELEYEVKRDSSGLWEAFLEILQPGAYEVAKAMLMAFEPLVTIEVWQPLKKQKLSESKLRFNDRFQKTAEMIGRMVDRLEDFDQTAIRKLSSEAAYPVVASFIYGEETISQAGFSLIKAITSQETREDAVRELLEINFVPVLSAYNKLISDITEKKSLWSPQFQMLRYSKNMLNVLCHPTSGLLRSKTLTNGEQAVLCNWWANQWVFLDVAFSQTEGWSQMVDVKIMKDFCREAMEFAEALLEQCALLESALPLGYSVDIEDVKYQSTMENILEQPRTRCFGLCRMLRLKDYYLVGIIVNVLVKLLKRLHQHKMTIPGQPLNYIRNVCTKDGDRFKVSTNLNSAQRAELSKALGEEEAEDVVEILAVKKLEAPKKQTKLDEWSKTGVESPSVPSDTSARAKPLPKSNRDDSSGLSKSVSTEKKPSLLKDIMGQQPTPKPLSRPSAQVDIASRKKALEARRLRDAQMAARARGPLRAPNKTVAGEGSGLQGLSGIHGKEHEVAQKSEIMVSSSEDEDGSDDDDAEFLARSGTVRKSNDDSKNRIQAMKPIPRGPVKKIKIERSKKDMRARLIPPMDILHQAILEWDIFHEGHDPPNTVACSEVADSYNDPHSYKQTFLPLLINEAWRSFVTAKDEVTAKPFETKIINRMNVDKFIEVSTAMPTKADAKDRFLSEGDIILFSHAPNPLEAKEELHCLARIWRVLFKNGTLEVQYRLSSKAGPILGTLMPQAEIYAVKITNMTTIEREFASLESLQFYDLAPEILSATPSPMLSFSNEAVDKVMGNYQLNPGQAKAVLHAKENDAFTLVQGPPGTGKTKTIIAMVGALLAGTYATVPTGVALKRPDGLQPGTSKGTAKKLLVCAPSNAAVDELVLRLKAGVKSMNGSFHKVNVLRLGRTDAINAAVKDVTLDELVKARIEGIDKQNAGPSTRELMHKEAGQIKLELGELRPQLESARERGDRDEANRLQRKFDEYKRRQAQIGAKIEAEKDSGNTAARESEIRRRQIQQEIMDSAQVLCATLSGSGHEMFKNLAVEFETVIIDEAAQCVELSALIPLKYGCSKCILVGDPKQLPPTVLSKSAVRYGYDQSLFVRMQRKSPQDIHLLDTQYRMHPAISSFPSQEFYERRLIDGGDMAKLRWQPWHRDEMLSPYRFFDVEGIQQQGQRGQSLINVKEIEVAIQLYKRLTNRHRGVDFKGKIGIITPYKAQLFALHDHFTKLYSEKITEEIEFNTTDAFQGRECEIIIFSCVRASPTGGIGFMTDIRRMNVGLTRAKSSLWILGNSKALQQGEFWAKLIVDAKQRDQYISGNVLALLQRPSTTPTHQASEHSASHIEDVVMENAPIVGSTIPHRYKSHQLPSTYTLVGRPQTNSPTSVGFGGINERGESAAVPRTTSDRPVIHESGNKRHREDGDAGNAAKRIAQKAITNRLPPTGPRAQPRPQDPSAMAVLGIPPVSNQHSSVASGSRPPVQPNQAKGAPPKLNKPTNMPPKKKAPADPFIKRKPNKR